MTERITFAIGDIHGCFAELQSLIQHCETAFRSGERTYIFLGDYVDRGARSREVVGFLRAMSEQARRFVCLRGNHEELLVLAARLDRSDQDLMTWWANGGEQTLDSYGVNDPADIPADDLEWLKRLPLKHQECGRTYVHAGIRPGIPIEQQSNRDLLWIREPFLSSPLNHGSLIVHGHTPTPSRKPEIYKNRVNIDTGACFGGPLTAAVFDEDDVLPSFFINSSGSISLADLKELYRQ